MFHVQNSVVTDTENNKKLQTIAYEYGVNRNYNLHNIIFNPYEQTSFPD